uniref:Uncharacterized protein ycf20 n=1 Tax=Dipterocladia arabiensis TaxID=2007176 RepID=A0A1Z1M059_9FLOR|nr:hypothetical protein [Dipterocladia arabiensis]ARW59348.1 hypothetical protein [Dipterocladia arabiensis]
MKFVYIYKYYKNSLQKFWTYKFSEFSLHLISLMLGFFFASILSTLPAQTGDWGIISAAIIVTLNEMISKIIYSYKVFNQNNLINYINDVKIGIVYGLFVDAFKLGS